MSVNYAKHVSTKQTLQSEPIPGEPQVPNSAGGYAYQVDDWKRLDRFLILGNSGGSYYTTERKLTQENAACVATCLGLDAARTVNRIVEISEAGRAPKNDPAIFALALAASHKPDVKARQAALAAMPRVCRTGTMLFQFNAMVEQLRGRGRALNRAVAGWYLNKPARDVAYQVTKYQQRDGWSHRDLLRLSKPHPRNAASFGTQVGECGHNAIFHWITKGWEGVGEEPHSNVDLIPIWAMERAKRATSAKELVKLIADHGLVRECVPTQFLNDPAVWEALLEKMPLTAMIRSLAKMTAVGLLVPLSNAARKVQDELGNLERLRKARVHPVGILAALLTYKQGHGDKGKLTWSPATQVIDALDGAFYASFETVEPTGKRWLLALDVSGSMGCGSIAGVKRLTPRVGSCAMAMVAAATEKQHHFVAFTSNGMCGRPSMHPGYPSGITPFSVSPKQRLDDVCRQTSALPMGGTDCALPMIYAAEQKVPVDVFCVFTDNETWAGNIHPVQALREYRQKMGIPAKLIVVGMVSNGFSIADPNDGGCMDVCGFDTSAPAVMADFARE